MATIKEIQSALDNKSLDIRNLNDDQKFAVDALLKSGELKGYGGINEIAAEQNAAMEILAAQKQQKLEPFETATGIERKDLELVGDVTGTIVPYIKNRDMLVKSLIANNAKAEFGVDQRAIISPEKINAFQKQLMKLPMVRGSKLLGRLASVVGKMGDFVRQGPGQIRMKGPTPFLYTEALSQFGGSVGAGVGSLTFDAANLMTDFAATTSEDLANVSEDDIRALPIGERSMVHAADAMKNALYFNFGAFALSPMLQLMTKGYRSAIGLEGERAYELAKKAREQSIPINTQALIDENVGFIAKGLKDAGKTITIFPAVGGPQKRARADIEKATYARMIDILDSTVPYADAQIMSYGAINQVKKNYREWNNIIDQQYLGVMRSAENLGGGNVPFIRMDNLLKEVKEIRKYYDEVVSPVGSRVEDPRIRGEIDQTMDPLLKYLKAIEDTFNYSSEAITGKQYADFHRQMKQAISLTNFENPLGIAARLDSAMKKDFNALANPESIDALLKNSRVKEAYDQQVKDFGQEAGNKYLEDLTNDVKMLEADLLKANELFTRSVRTFKSQGSALKGTNIFNKFDSNIFTQKGLLNIAGKQNINADKLWEDGLLNVFKNGDDASITNVRKLLGTDRGGQTGKTGQAIFDRFRQIYFFDAFNDAYMMKPKLNSVPLFQKLETIRNKGFMHNKFLHNANEEIIADELTKAGMKVDEVIESGVADIPFDQLRLKVDEVAQFDPARFRKNLGLVGTTSEVATARNRLISMYGGGKEGSKAVRQIEDILEVMEGQYSYDLGDASTYLKRRFQMGGLGSVMGGILPMSGTIAAGAGVATVGLLPTVSFILLGRYAGKILSDPQRVKQFYDLVFDPMKRMDQLSGTGEFKSYFNQPMTKAQSKSFADLYNYVLDEDKDSPTVDPQKIDFNEITRYLLQTPTRVPQSNFTIDGIAEDIKNRMYPELKQIKNSSTEMINDAENYFRGNMLSVMENDASDRIDNEAISLGSMTQASGQAGMVAPIAPVQPIQPVNRAKTFAALNPNDTLGQLIAENPNA